MVASSHSASVSTGRRHELGWLVVVRQAAPELLCLVFWWLLYGLFLGNCWLLDVDEPRYSQASWEMLSRGDWLIPWFNDLLRLDKPVWFYWTQMVSYLLFGVSEFAARLPSVLMQLLTVVVTYGVGRTLVNRSFGILSALVVSTMLMELILGRMAITDMTLASWMWVTVVSLFWVFRQHSGGQYRWIGWVVATMAAAAGVLTKGPVALALPVLTMAIYVLVEPVVLGLSGRENQRSPRIRPHRAEVPSLLIQWRTLGLFSLVSLCLAAPWYLLAAQQLGSLFWEKLFFHNVTRFQSVVSSHHAPWWFYIPVALVGFIPWTFLLPSALPWLSRQWGRLGAGKSVLSQADTLNSRRCMLLGVLWFGVVVGFFTIAQTKLMTYILPAMAGLAFPMAGYLYALMTDKAFRNQTLRKLGVLFSVISGVFGLVLVVYGLSYWLTHGYDAILAKQLRLAWFLTHEGEVGFSLLRLGIPVVLVLLVGVFGTMAWACARLRSDWVVGGMLLLALLLGLSREVAFRQVTWLNQTDLMQFIQQTPTRDAMVMYGTLRPGLVFYRRQPVESIPQETPERLLALARRHGHVWVVMKNKRVPELQATWQPLPLTVDASLRGRLYTLMKLTPTPVQEAKRL
jgi:4-amino-4-deoxy-L-arabinose transferase-like glycosyltransferase